MIRDVLFFAAGAASMAALLVSAHVVSVKAIENAMTTKLAGLESRLTAALNTIKSKV